MGENIVQVTEGTGKKLHTWDTTIGANLVQDEFTLPGEYPYATYFVTASASVATANDHLLQIMAGGTNKVRIRRIGIEQSTNATTAAPGSISILRVTTAGTGGTAVTPRPGDSSDAAAGATCMTLPTVKGTEGVEFIRTTLLWRQAVSATAAAVDDAFTWYQMPNAKGLVIPAGVTNGIVIKQLTAIAAANAVINVEFVETPF